jgi:cbb3-type cytochrome oxidase maturation protein
MEVLNVLISVSLLLVASFVTVCLLAIRGGQFDDMESPRWRVLFDGPGSRGGIAGSDQGTAEGGPETAGHHERSAQARRSDLT